MEKSQILVSSESSFGGGYEKLIMTKIAPAAIYAVAKPRCIRSRRISEEIDEKLMEKFCKKGLGTCGNLKKLQTRAGPQRSS